MKKVIVVVTFYLFSALAIAISIWDRVRGLFSEVEFIVWILFLFSLVYGVTAALILEKKAPKKIGNLMIGQHNGETVAWINSEYNTDELLKFDSVRVSIQDVRGDSL